MKSSTNAIATIGAALGLQFMDQPSDHNQKSPRPPDMKEHRQQKHSGRYYQTVKPMTGSHKQNARRFAKGKQ